MQRLLFRDWRFALLWAIGLTASVAAFFSQGGGHEDLARRTDEIKASRQAMEQSAGEAQPQPAVEPTVIEEDEGPSFGEPQLDTTPLDPTPKDDAANVGQLEAEVQP
jgi:hypothetical protein